MPEKETDKNIIQDPPRPLPDVRLAWDMAKIQEKEYGRARASRQRELIAAKGLSINPEERTERLERIESEITSQAKDAAQRLEDRYYTEVAMRDDDYYDIEAQYGNIMMNKSDLAEYIASLRTNSDPKTRAIDAALVTRVWNVLGQSAAVPLSDIQFEKIAPTGVIKPRSSYSGRGWADREKIDFIDLKLSGLIRDVNKWRTLEASKSASKLYGSEPNRTSQVIAEFSDFMKAKADQQSGES